MEYKLPPQLTAENSVDLWQAVLSSGGNSEKHKVDASDLKFCDESGLALLYEIRRKSEAFELSNVPDAIEKLYASMTRGFTDEKQQQTSSLNLIELAGLWLSNVNESTKQSLVFLGQSVYAVIYSIFHPNQIRFGEILQVADESGSRAVGIICLIGFLMGIIIAFETALVAQIFGAVIFVVNGIGIAMTRELGPLMTAILFAGRSGSSFAAQIGTQKVNEELNALTTFGLPPLFFLVVPRLMASIIVVPLLSIFAVVIGIIGGGIVMGIYDITFTQFYIQLIHSIDLGDVIFGLVKAAIFGFVIALIGCECGMSTGAGAAAVGVSTTRAVVKSIIWIVVIDGIAALLSNRLGF